MNDQRNVVSQKANGSLRSHAENTHPKDGDDCKCVCQCTCNDPATESNEDVDAAAATVENKDSDPSRLSASAVHISDDQESECESVTSNRDTQLQATDTAQTGTCSGVGQREHREQISN